MEQAVEQPRLVQITPPGLMEAWEMVASQLRMEMTAGNFASWVEPLRPLSFNEGIFRLGVANQYARDWLETRLLSRITRLLEGVYSRPVTVHFSIRALDDGGAPAAEAVGAGTTVEEGLPAGSNARKKKPARSPLDPGEGGSPRKIQLQRAYGTERARVIQPERGMFLTMYFFNRWLPLLGHSAATTVLAARSMCYWNPMTGELRNVVETDMSELAQRAAVSVRTVKDVLNNALVKKYFLRYKVRRVMTPNGVRTAGIILQVRMDDPLTDEDQSQHHLVEEERWYSADFEDERED